MSLVIERDAFLSGLSAVRRIVIRNLTIPILQNIRMEAAGGKLTLLAHSCDACTTVTVAAEGDLNPITAPCEMLYGLVNALPKGSHVTIVLDKERLVLTSGRSKYRLPTLPERDFPLVLEVKNQIAECTLTANDAVQLFKRPARAAENTETRIYLNGIYLHAVGGKLAACATDGHRLVRTIVDVATDTCGVIVSNSACAEILKLNAEEITLSWSKDIISATAGNITLASKFVAGTFPDYVRAVPASYGAYLEMNRLEFAGAISRMAVISGPHLVITWDDDPSSIAISVVGLEEGAEEVSCTASHMPAGVFGVSPRQLQEVAAVLHGDAIRLHWIDKDSALKLSDPAEPDVLVIQMPRYMPAQQAAA